MERTERGTMPHQVILQDRGELELTGVSDVDSFDDSTVLVYTSLGQLTVKGKELRVRRLDLEGGNLSLAGQVDSLVYTQAVSGGFFSRLLR